MRRLGQRKIQSNNYYFYLTTKDTRVAQRTQGNFLLISKIGGDMTENEIAKIVFDKGLKIHKTLGPGLLESSYEECLYYELCQAGLNVEKQKALPLVYEEVKLDAGYRIDLLVENKIVIELKAVDALNQIHLAQILTYLKLSKCKLGLLINFNTLLFKDGMKRVINGSL